MGKRCDYGPLSVAFVVYIYIPSLLNVNVVKNISDSRVD